jgi:drug/metabolite transporter (DMT)-like permease
VIDVFGVCALLASGITANKIILSYVPAAFFVGLRMFLAGFVLLVGICFRQKGMQLSRLKKDWLELLLLSSIITFIPSLLKAYALQSMPLQKATLLASFDPFVTALYAYSLFGERLSLKKIIGMCVGFFGVLLCLFSTSSFMGASLLHFATISWPELSAIMAVFINRYGWIRVAAIIKSNRYDTYEINSIMMLFGGILAFLSSFYLGTFSLSSLLKMPEGLWALLAYTVLIGNVLAYTLWSKLFKKYSVSFMSLIGFSIPIFSSLYGALFLGERLVFNFVIAAAVIFAGLLIFYQEESKNNL